MTPIKLKRLTPKVIQPSPPKLKALSLFSGIGGLDIAAHAAGIETLACCEIEPFAVQILNRRFPGIPVFNDVRKITRGTIEELLSGKDYSDVVELYERGMTVEEIAIIHNAPVGFMRGVLRRRGIDIKGEEEVVPDGSCIPIIDVIHGGFPCQDLSVAGKQAGLTGERSGLWYEMLRLVEELQPYYVVAENVRGACNLALPAVQAGLERTNYQVQSCVLPASAFGAPHRRERLFVLGVRRDVADSTCERLQRLWTAREQESEVYAGKIVPVCDSVRDGKLWPTPTVGTSGGGKLCGGTGHLNMLRDALGYEEARKLSAGNGGQLNPEWVEVLMGYPIGWTDPDCDEPEPWPGWPARMGERLWNTVSADDGKPSTAIRPGRTAENEYLRRQVTHVHTDQYAYEPPRTCTGIPNRAARLKCLGNAVVPAQAFPIFNTIEILETLLIKN